MDNQSAHFEAQKGARLVELEELLEAHKVEVARLTKDVAHYQGLVERYGGSTTEIHDLESEGEGGGGGTRPGEDDTGVIVTRSLRDELAKNEALQGGALVSLSQFEDGPDPYFVLDDKTSTPSETTTP